MHLLLECDVNMSASAGHSSGVNVLVAKNLLLHLKHPGIHSVND